MQSLRDVHMVVDGVRVEYGGDEVRVMTGGVKANERALEVKDGEVEEVVGEGKRAYGDDNRGKGGNGGRKRRGKGDLGGGRFNLTWVISFPTALHSMLV